MSPSRKLRLLAGRPGAAAPPATQGYALREFEGSALKVLKGD